MGRREGQPHGPFNPPALVRTPLADSLAYALILIDALSGVLRCWVSKSDSPFWTP